MATTGNRSQLTSALASTIVAYTPGNIAAARALARSLGVSESAVKPIDAATQADAQQAQKNVGAATGNIDVVVTVGTDKATTQ